MSGSSILSQRRDSVIGPGDDNTAHPSPYVLPAASGPPNAVARTIYTPIEKWQTRILRLHPRFCGQLLSADLLVVDLVALDSGLVLHEDRQHVEYEAISYTWGGTELTCKIACNDLLWPITRTLQGALERVRCDGKFRYLWVDQICINQEDEAEKAIQVQHLFTIFNKAQKVVAWLGEAGDLTEHVLKALHERSFLPNHLIEAGLVDLCLRHWPRRVWVQQEVFAAREVILFCGHFSFSLETYQKAASRLRAMRTQSIKGDGDTELGVALRAIEGLRVAGPTEVRHLACEKMLAQVGMRSSPGERRLSSPHTHQPAFVRWWSNCVCNAGELESPSQFPCLLMNAGYLEASDMRDRVYGLLGISDVSTTVSKEVPMLPGEHILPLDYSRSVSRVFQDVTKYIINRYRNIHILWAHTPNLTTSRELALPSWTPDWRTFTEHTNLDYDGVESISWQHYFHEDFLRLQGRIVGGISFLEGSLDEALAEEGPLHHLRSFKIRAFPECVGHESTDNSWLMGMPFATPGDAQVGDCIAIILGSARPIVLRSLRDPDDNRRLYTYVGVAISNFGKKCRSSTWGLHELIDPIDRLPVESLEDIMIC